MGSRENARSLSVASSLLATLVLTGIIAVLLFQNVQLRNRLQNNSLTIHNLSRQVEALTVENSQLREQNDHLTKTLQDYQLRVRSYQAQLYQLKKKLNLTGENQTTLGWRTTVSIIAPAVKKIEYRDIFGFPEGEKYVGIATNLTLEAVPGLGRVLVNTDPPMGEVFQDTAVTAKETAEKISGLSLSKYDLIFSVQANDTVPSVDGPSAGAAMTLLVLGLLENLTINHRVSLTGTISPDGKIGAIGGVVEKAVAAEKAGIKIFCIPKENEYTAVTYYQRVGPFVIPYQKLRKTVDLISAKTNLTVYLVDDIHDVAKIATKTYA